KQSTATLQLKHPPNYYWQIQGQMLIHRNGLESQGLWYFARNQVINKESLVYHNGHVRLSCAVDVQFCVDRLQTHNTCINLIKGCITFLPLLASQHLLCSCEDRGVLSVTVGSQTTLMVEVEAGDDVTLWCRTRVTEPARIYWLKHTSTSIPERLTCQQYSLYAPPRPCSLIPQSNRTVMNLNSENASLRITEVNYTDSGLYYCCTQRNQHIRFSNATLLLVQELFFILTVVFSAVVVILLSALLILKNRKPCRDDAGSTVKKEKERQEQNRALVKGAALQFSRKWDAEVETCVEYSSLRVT
ncbi:hypothetical protein NFI96_006119, partial [Prochilodus magdalenae]